MCEGGSWKDVDSEGFGGAAGEVVVGEMRGKVEAGKQDEVGRRVERVGKIISIVGTVDV